MISEVIENSYKPILPRQKGMQYLQKLKVAHKIDRI